MTAKITNTIWVYTIIIVGFLVYANSLFNGFVWDDQIQILDNPVIHSISNIGTFFAGSTFYGGGSEGLVGMYYRPIMTTSFSFIYSLFGATAFPFHLLSLALQLTNAILLFVFFKKFFPRNIAGGLSLVFLVHPMNTEVVDYVSALGDELTFTFGISGFLLLTEKKELKPLRLCWVGLLFLLSLLSKETGILFLVAAFIYRYLYYKEIKHSSIVGASCLAIYGFFRFVVAQISMPVQPFIPIMVATSFEKLITAPKVFTYYINTFFFPLHLAISQQWVVRSITLNDFYLPLIEFLGVLIVLGLIYLWITRQDKKLLNSFILFLSLFILGLIAHSHIIPLYMTVADRWFYVTSIGLLGILGIAFILLRQRFHYLHGETILVIGTILVLILSARTFIRNFDWKDGFTLYSHDMQINTTSFDLENNIGNEYYKRGDLETAKIHFERSIQLTTDDLPALNNLGSIYFHQNNIPKAKYYYQQVVDHSDDYLAYQNLARILILYDTPQSTKDFVEKSLQKFPNNARLWAILAIADSKLHQNDQALAAAQKAYQLNPDQLDTLIYQKLIRGEDLSGIN